MTEEDRAGLANRLPVHVSSFSSENEEIRHRARASYLNGYMQAIFDASVCVINWVGPEHCAVQDMMELIKTDGRADRFYEAHKKEIK